MATFNIQAAPGTDIWRKPPHTDVWNTPTATPPGTTSTSGSLPNFISARVSFSSNWTEQYDQAGLLFSLHKKGDPVPVEKSPPKWIKTGVEFYNGKPMLSTVACDTWADWSVSPLTAGPGAGEAGSKTWTTVLVQKEGDEHGMSLWVYEVLENGDKVPLREICWVLGHALEEWNLEVLALAARPAKDAKGPLEVEMKDMEVKWTA